MSGSQLGSQNQISAIFFPWSLQIHKSLRILLYPQEEVEEPFAHCFTLCFQCEHPETHAVSKDEPLGSSRLWAAAATPECSLHFSVFTSPAGITLLKSSVSWTFDQFDGLLTWQLWMQNGNTHSLFSHIQWESSANTMKAHSSTACQSTGLVVSCLTVASLLGLFSFTGFSLSSAATWAVSYFLPHP